MELLSNVVIVILKLLFERLKRRDNLHAAVVIYIHVAFGFIWVPKRVIRENTSNGHRDEHSAAEVFIADLDRLLQGRVIKAAHSFLY